MGKVCGKWGVRKVPPSTYCADVFHTSAVSSRWAALYGGKKDRIVISNELLALQPRVVVSSDGNGSVLMWHLKSN